MSIFISPFIVELLFTKTNNKTNTKYTMKQLAVIAEQMNTTFRINKNKIFSYNLCVHALYKYK